MKGKQPIRKRKRIIAPKDCALCTDKKEPSIIEIEVLRRYLTERGKIIGRARSGICSKHQRNLTLAIKHARHLALLPFVSQR